MEVFGWHKGRQLVVWLAAEESKLFELLNFNHGEAMVTIKAPGDVIRQAGFVFVQPLPPASLFQHKPMRGRSWRSNKPPPLLRR